MTLSDVDVFGDFLCLTSRPSISTGQFQQQQGLAKVSSPTVGAAFLFLYFLSIFTKQYYHKCSGLQQHKFVIVCVGLQLGID